tara:strand:- start:38 stop:856 length:819 start_codon:yes stop_codon:yes gene_type:complete
MTFQKASLCRHFENEVYKRVNEKIINFPVYLSAGQEYTPSSIAQLTQNKRHKPMLFGQHRGHSIYLSFGGNVVELIDELLGKKTGCTRGMGGSLSISSNKINMFGHEGLMGSNACMGVGACFASAKPTIVFLGDASVEEDYVLASLSWAAKKKLPILFVVEDNNYAVLTKKEDRRDWKAKDVAKAFKLDSYDIDDQPQKIFNVLKRNIFKKPIFINVHTKRLYWHAGAGKDEKVKGDRLSIEMKYLGKKAEEIDKKIKRKVEKLWQDRLEKR